MLLSKNKFQKECVSLLGYVTMQLVILNKVLFQKISIKMRFLGVFLAFYEKYRFLRHANIDIL